MSDDKYRPRSFVLDDPGPDPVSLINERVAPDNVSTLVRPKQRSLHAVLCEALNNTQAFVNVRFTLKADIQAPAGMSALGQ